MAAPAPVLPTAADPAPAVPRHRGDRGPGRRAPTARRGPDADGGREPRLPSPVSHAPAVPGRIGPPAGGAGYCLMTQTLISGRTSACSRTGTR